jgi:hypothetical protein
MYYVHQKFNKKLKQIFKGVPIQSRPSENDFLFKF